VHRDHDRVGEEKVVPHGRGDGDRVVGHQCHERRRQRGGQTCGDEHGAEIHPRRAEDRWLHKDDVGHRQKCCETGQRFRTDRRAVSSKRETAIQEIHRREILQHG
jgi:hypothetical protein